MTLTPDGPNLFGYAERVRCLAGEAEQTKQLPRLGGQLRIGSIESAAAARLPSLLSSYHSRWPEVDIGLAIGTSRSLTQDVADGKLDCAFVAIECSDAIGEMGLHSPEANLCALQAYQEEIVLIVPQTHSPIVDAGSLTLDTMAVFANGCTYRSVLEQWLGKSEVPRRDWKVMEQVSYHAILTCVAAGLCFAACPRSVLNLRRVPIGVKVLTISWVDTYFVYRHSSHATALGALLDSVRHEQEPVVPACGPRDTNRG